MLNKMFAKLCASNATCLCVLDTANIQFELLHNLKLKSQDFRGMSFMDGPNLETLKIFIPTFSQQIVMTIYIFEISLFSAVIAKC